MYSARKDACVCGGCVAWSVRAGLRSKAVRNRVSSLGDAEFRLPQMQEESSGEQNRGSDKKVVPDSGSVPRVYCANWGAGGVARRRCCAGGGRRLCAMHAVGSRDSAWDRVVSRIRDRVSSRKA